MTSHKLNPIHENLSLVYLVLQQELRRACAYAQSRQSLCFSYTHGMEVHVDEGSHQINTSSAQVSNFVQLQLFYMFKLFRINECMCHGGDSSVSIKKRNDFYQHGLIVLI